MPFVDTQICFCERLLSGFPPFVGEPQVEGVMQFSSEFPSVKIQRFVSRRTPYMISRCQWRD